MTLTVKEMSKLLNAEILCGKNDDLRVVKSAFGADLMSDVLAFVREETVLITGLVNMHVIRTAEMTDVTCIIFSRGKRPTKEILSMAKELNIILLTTTFTTYEVCGILYSKGLPSIRKIDNDKE